MRRFLFLSHTVPPTGEWGLDDLAGGAGRVDVLCRNLQSAFCISHGLRSDVEATVVFVADPDRPAAVRIEGGKIQRFNPDERSTAARLQQALAAWHEDPWWEEVQAGLFVAPFTLREILEESPDDAVPVLLDPHGTPLEEAELPAEPVFLLSDHVPFTGAEYALLDGLGADRVSLGDAWYHGNHVVSVVQWVMDLRSASQKTA